MPEVCVWSLDGREPQRQPAGSWQGLWGLVFQVVSAEEQARQPRWMQKTKFRCVELLAVHAKGTAPLPVS